MPSIQKSKSGNNLADKDASKKAHVLRQYVQNALASRTKDVQSTSYNSFLKELQALRRKLESGHDDAAEFSLVSLLHALRDCAGSIKEGSHDAVLTSVLSMGLWSCSSPVRDAVLELIVELIVSSSAFIPNCLQVLLFNLLPPPGSPPLQPDVPGAAWETPPVAVEVQAAVVNAIEQAVQLVPALPTRLLPMLIQNMPHKLRDRAAQCLFLRAIILLCEGKVGPALRDGLLSGVVEHLLTIDTEIRWEDIVDAPTGYDQEEGASDDELFDLEGLIDLEIDPSTTDHQQQLADLQDGFHDPAAFAAAGHQGVRRQQQLAAAAAAGAADAAGSNGKPSRLPVDVTADKLDSMMELTFAHLHRRVAAGQLGNVWQTMLRSFEARLLHAHRCKFTQFLLFFLAIQDPSRCCSSFSACLMSILRDTRQAPITRCACAAYLASFLARCALAPKQLVVDMLQKLTAASQEYADAALQAAHRHQQQQQQQSQRIGGSNNGLKSSSSDAALVLLAGLSDLVGQGPLNVVSAATGGNGGSSTGAMAAIQRHQVFYAMVQALLYLLCYHMQPLLSKAGEGGQQQQQAGASSDEQQQLGQAVAALVKQQVLPLLSHPLAPLAVCHQAVTAEFVRQALLLDLADAEWEAAALEAVSQHQAALAAAASAASAIVIGGDAAGNGADGGGSQLRVLRPLEVFFPFDPYLLRRSARFLQLPRSYTCFSNGHPHAAGAAAGGRGTADEDESSSEDDEDGDDTTSDDEGDWDAAAGSQSEDGSSTTSSSSEGDDGGPLDFAGNVPAAGENRAARAARGPLPLGLAAVQQHVGMVLSGPSPAPDMMATSYLSADGAGYLVGGSYESGEALFGNGQSPLMGSSPMPMSITPYDGSYMQNLQAQLNGPKAPGMVQ